MVLRTNVGQIYLTHPRDENFTSVYQEAFTKHGQSVELFVVVEISGSNGGIRALRPEYEKLVQAFVSALKKTYVAAQTIDENTFEKALAAINASLSKIASRGRVNWYGKFHAAVGAFWQNQLALSSVGNAIVYLARKNEISSLTDNLNDEANRPVKIFSNFSTGKLAAGDRVIITTNQLFNYLSLERIHEFLADSTLEEACQEIVSALKEAKTAGFATFIFETFAPGQTLAGAASPAKSAEETKSPAPSHKAPSDLQKIGSIAWGVLLSALKLIWMAILKILDILLGLVSRLFGKKSKKYVVGAIIIALLIFGINLGISAMRKSNQQKTAEIGTALSAVAQKLDEAEAAMIYGDQNRIASLLTEAENSLGAIKAESADNKKRKDEITARLTTLKTEINKETPVDNPTILTSYANIPTDLIYSPNGIIGFNRDSGSVAFYDFRTGETKSILKDENTGDLVAGAYVGGDLGYVFLTRSGDFSRLDLAADNLVNLGAEGGPPLLDLAAIEPRDMAVLGEGTIARLYLLDSKQNQIWRIRVTASGLAAPEPWLKTSASFETARSLAIDGSIYINFSDRIEKFFGGTRADFDLSQTVPPVSEIAGSLAQSEGQYLYVLSPKTERIVMFTKTGGLFRQLVSPKFRDLADIYVDETNKVIHAAAGSELLQISF